MPVPMFIPPWLTPPDPVATYQRGVQIGAQIGEAQANQRLRAAALEQEANAQAVRAAREQQEMEQTNAYRQAQLGLEASETARRVQGQMKYTALVQGGMDPLQAMMQTPEVWGSSLTGVASALRAQKAAEAAANFKPYTYTDEQGNQFAMEAPGRSRYIKPPVSKNLDDYQVKDIEGTDSRLVIHPNGTASVVAKSGVKSDQATKSAQIRFLSSRLNNIDAIIAKGDAENIPQLKIVRQRILKQLEALDVAQADMFDESAPTAGSIGTAPTTKYPGVRSVKRL